MALGMSDAYLFVVGLVGFVVALRAGERRGPGVHVDNHLISCRNGTPARASTTVTMTM
jgi:hypothetical protein